MLDDFKLLVLAGGFSRCDSTWSKVATGVERCYKVYIPVAGQASIGTGESTFQLKPGQITFISGFRLKFQRCEHRMDVHWVHFMPESLYLRYLLDQIPPVQQWQDTRDSWTGDICAEIPRMFPPWAGNLQPPREDTPPATACLMQGLLLIVVARLLRGVNSKTLASFHPRYYQLKPALDFMEAHYTENPPLRTIAGQVHLAPVYFHRQFSRLFGISPFNYIMNRRLSQARHLLSSTSMTIKQVAEAVGYDNPLYFSRIFSGQMSMSPSDYRKTFAG